MRIWKCRCWLEEWNGFFTGEDKRLPVDLTEVRNLVGDGDLSFAFLIYSNGYPNDYFVCLQDPKPTNPTVFFTDHEHWFVEIYGYLGSMSEFLKNRYIGPKEIRRHMTKYIKSIA